MTTMALYMQYGAGLCGPERWRNYDASPSLQLQRIPLCGALFKRLGPSFPTTVRYGDIVKGLPVAPMSCDAVYCSHILEHLALNDCRLALRNTFSCLTPGGRFRLVLPDLERLAHDYVANPATDAALLFMNGACLGTHQRPRGILGFLRGALGNSAHLWMWDYKAMQRELLEAGFERIRRAEFGDSGDPMFQDVEDLGRWHNNLGIECFRPH